MRRAFADTLRPALDAMRTTLSDPDLRGLLVAWFTVMAGKWAFLVAGLVIAYDAGGAVAVGIFGLARYLPPTILAPFTGLLTVRWAPEVVFRTTNAARTLTVAAAFLVVVTDMPFAVYLLVVALEAGIGAATRPLYMALLPAIARTPSQLVAANVASSAMEGIGTFAGPAVAGLLLTQGGPASVILAVVVVYAAGVWAIARLTVPAVGRPVASVAAALDQVTAGVRAVATLSGPRLVVLDLGAQTFVRGLLTVLVVVASVELLPLGDPGVGTLNAMMGLGGLLGALVAALLAGRERLGPAFLLALAGWGLPIAVFGLVPTVVVALLAMTMVGVSNSVLDVAGFTLVQRTTPNQSRVAVLGLLDSVANGGVAVGGIVAPVLIVAFGTAPALIMAGAILPLAALLSVPLMRRIDEGGPAVAERVDLLRANPLFAPLSLATIEYLSACLQPVEYDDGAWLMREGDHGTEYLLIETGTVTVSQGGRAIRDLGPGSGVGEIALLRHVHRTASVQARGSVRAFSLHRDAFLEAVTGHAVGRAVATTVADEHLAADAERPALH
jgi:predicted MFS family arabinose efflux permease